MHFTASSVQELEATTLGKLMFTAQPCPAPMRNTEQMLFSWCFYLLWVFLLLFPEFPPHLPLYQLLLDTLSGHQDCYSSSPLFMMS